MNTVRNFINFARATGNYTHVVLLMEGGLGYNPKYIFPISDFEEYDPWGDFEVVGASFAEGINYTADRCDPDHLVVITYRA